MSNNFICIRPFNSYHFFLLKLESSSRRRSMATNSLVKVGNERCKRISIQIIRVKDSAKIILVLFYFAWQRLKALDLMSLQRRRERYIIIHMWKILHYKCPNDINIQFCAPSRLGTKAVIPEISKSSSQRNQTRYDASFVVMGPRLWNIIPGNLHSIDSLLRFKTNLKAF